MDSYIVFEIIAFIVLIVGAVKGWRFISSKENSPFKWLNENKAINKIIKVLVTIVFSYVFATMWFIYILIRIFTKFAK